MSATPRLLEVTNALSAAGLKFLIMGGHAVRHYGVERNTADFDFQISSDARMNLPERLKGTSLFAQHSLREGASWRPDDFRRFQIGVLPNGKEEWLEFWFRNHLLAPFEEAYERREEVKHGDYTLCYLALLDLICSKETERDDDWADVRILEEVFDERNLNRASNPVYVVKALSQLRSLRGFERAEAGGHLKDQFLVEQAMRFARHPISCAFLLPFAARISNVRSNVLPDAVLATALSRVDPGSQRHLALVEAVRLAYQRAAKAADRADKERRRRESGL